MGWGGARQKNLGDVQHWSGMPDSEPAASLVASIKQGTAARQTKVPEVFCVFLFLPELSSSPCTGRENVDGYKTT